MSLKTRRRKMDRFRPLARYNRARKSIMRQWRQYLDDVLVSGKKQFEEEARFWFAQPSIIGRLIPNDQPVSGKPITSNAMYPQGMKTAGPE